MDQYFQQMEKIVKQRKTSSRVRFMLQDVIELRHVREISEVRSYFCCNVTINALNLIVICRYLCVHCFRRNFSGCQGEKIIIRRQLTKFTRRLLKKQYKKISLYNSTKCNNNNNNSNSTPEVKVLVEVRHICYASYRRCQMS